MKQIDWKYIVLFILAIPVVNQLGDYLGKSSAQHINEKVKVGIDQYKWQIMADETKNSSKHWA